MATRIKHCGITSVEDAELAVESGAWALGMIFWPQSPRSCAPDVARQIGSRLRRRAEIAGVFVNQSLDEIAALAEMVPLSLVQLHGDEGPSFCIEVARRTGAKVIKAARIRSKAELQALAAFRSVDYHLVDAHVEGLRGGTGQTVDWALLSGSISEVPLILSGGLTAENVGEAVATVHPFAVDVASGTEAEPGIKDPEKLRAFGEAVAAADPVVAEETEAEPEHEEEEVAS
ncbi:MAG: phosphoribosylanthranilate isomerase [Solirubrobacterales bacterium]|nr:phosphoribosylanthranilate isomerase [Solirubrobacterales bacterium]